jgi:hypothetical protein
LDNLIESIFRDRQQFIKNENKTSLNSDIHQYAVFGFVIRQLYSQEWLELGHTGKPSDPDFNSINGNYAISINESIQMMPHIRKN